MKRKNMTQARKTSEVFLSVGEVAMQLGVGRSRVYQLVNKHRIPSMRLGRSIRIPRDAWERFLAEAGLGGLLDDDDPSTAAERRRAAVCLVGALIRDAAPKTPGLRIVPTGAAP